ncbi:MAG: hypothetical protein IAF38_09625, partial [Bacteroidia bacterium]|nr:hypothetical protein [Bacteroidia bacterium]
MKLYKLAALFICIFILLASCAQKKIPEGQLINVNGFVIDTVKNKRLSDVKIYLVSGNSYNSMHAGGWDWMRVVDSALTDRAGNFKFQYTSEGESEDYAVSIEKTIRDNNASVTNDGYPVYAFNKAPEIKDKAIYVRELNIAKIHLKIIDNPYDTLIIDVYNYTNSRKNYFVIGKNVDTTLLLNCLVPQRKNNIYYKYSFFRELQIMRANRSSVTVLDSVFPGLADTSVLNRTIRPAKELESASPYEFTVGGNDREEVSLAALINDNDFKPNETTLKI